MYQGQNMAVEGSNSFYSAGRDLLEFVLEQVDKVGQLAFDGAKGLSGILSTVTGNLVHGTGDGTVSYEPGGAEHVFGREVAAVTPNNASEVGVNEPTRSISDVMGKVQENLSALGEQAVASIESIRNNASLSFAAENLGETGRIGPLADSLTASYTPSAGITQQQGAALG